MISATIPATRAASARVDRAELDLRHAAIRASMVTDGLDLLLIYSPPMRNFDIHYAAHYDLIGRGAVMSLPIAGEPVLYIGEEWDLDRARRVSPLADVRYEADLASLFGTLLRTKNSAITGLDWNGAGFAAKVRAVAGGDVRDGTATLERAARRKTAVEQALIREASALADMSFLCALEKAVAGMPEFELQAEMEYAMRKAGAVDNFGLFSSRKHNNAINFVTDKPIEDGDLLIFEITPARLNRNYSAQLCRTISMGPARPAVREKIAILAEAQEAGLAACRAGTPISEVVDAQNEAIAKHGFGEYCVPPYMRARGHGFGIGRQELSASNKRPLEAGMALVVHPNQYFPDVGYLAMGEMIIVTETGYERLCTLDRKVFEKT
jgi:Xaa-Pro dipeptidase